MTTTSSSTTATSTERRARPADRGALAATLAAAFLDDPVFAWLTPDEERRRAILPEFFTLAAEIFARHDETWCSDDGTVGAAIWSPPGVEPMTETDGERFAGRCVELAGPEADRWLEVVTLLDGNHPQHADHAYLWLLGVRPEWHGRGRGSALLRAVLDPADAAGVPAYLEATSRENLRLYQRHGFHVTGELEIAGGPSLWAMWREPLG